MPTPLNDVVDLDNTNMYGRSLRTFIDSDMRDYMNDCKTHGNIIADLKNISSNDDYYDFITNLQNNLYDIDAAMRDLKTLRDLHEDLLVRLDGGF